MSVPDYFVWARVGRHAQQDLLDILEEKKKQGEEKGLFTWGFGFNITLENFKNELERLLDDAGPRPEVLFSLTTHSNNGGGMADGLTYDTSKAYELKTGKEARSGLTVHAADTKLNHHFALVCEYDSTDFFKGYPEKKDAYEDSLDPQQIHMLVKELEYTGDPWHHATAIVKYDNNTDSGKIRLIGRTRLVEPYIVYYEPTQTVS